MRVAVVSDIHSNLVALEAVLEAVDAARVDELWCLGDVVGYGPRPNECCRLTAARASICLAGNHDLAVRGTIDLEEFSGDAAVAARWTRDVLVEDSSRFLAGLEPQGSLHGVALFHASARDPVWEYVLSDEAAGATLELADAPLVLVGHSHAALLADDAGGRLAADGTEVDLAQGRHLLNPGSVGQPRDGDPRAAWLLLDLEGQTASFRRVEYDVDLAQRQIRQEGLPEPLAARLALGQ